MTSPPSTSSACRRSSAIWSTRNTPSPIRRTRPSPASATSCGPASRITREAHGRNAVFYGEKAIDRSPCGTGTSARIAQLAARGELKVGDDFVHESIIGSLFRGRVEKATAVGDHAAIVPSIAGQAWITGHNTIWLDDRDPFVKGFSVL